eukprot:6201786-Pleurochrysis_carterae.AAC.4
MHAQICMCEHLCELASVGVAVSALSCTYVCTRVLSFVPALPLAHVLELEAFLACALLTTRASVSTCARTCAQCKLECARMSTDAT